MAAPAPGHSRWQRCSDTSTAFSTAGTTPGMCPHERLGGEGCWLCALLEGNSWQREKTQPVITFLVEFEVVSCLVVFVNQQELWSWRNMIPSSMYPQQKSL